VSVIDTNTETQIAHMPVHNPEPALVRNGRPVLYDAMLSSSNGEASCAACHVFGDFDSLAWDPRQSRRPPLVNNNPFAVGGGASFNPLKGPMTTQSLRGMANHGPMHWRGDRPGANNPAATRSTRTRVQPLIVAFDGLPGRGGLITNAQCSRVDFILQVTYPPNPIRALNNSFTGPQQAGHDVFFGPVTDFVFDCNGCHVLNPAAGFFGGNGGSSIEGETQEFKVPHLRNLYQKVGMFGLPVTPGVDGTGVNTGDQVRGFGFLHDGSIDTIFRFHSASVFSIDDAQQLALEQFMLAMDSNLAPIVGQSITLTSTNSAVVGGRINLLIARAAVNECELTVKGVLAGEPRGWLRLANGTFTSDDANESALTDAQLRAQATTAGQERTYMCVPPGSGTRVGIDRDEDGFRDHDELQAGSDPADPLSTPGGTTSTTTTNTTTTSPTTTTTVPGATLIPTRRLTLRDRTVPVPDSNRRRFSFRAATTTAAPANQIMPPANGSPNDPTTANATLFVYNSAGQMNDLSPRARGRVVVVAAGQLSVQEQRGRRADHAGRPQEEPAHDQGRQGGLHVHARRAIAGPRRGRPRHGIADVVRRGAGEGHREPAVDREERSRRQVRRPAERASGELSRTASLIVALGVTRSRPRARPRAASRRTACRR
jgi:hypothetical protein